MQGEVLGDEVMGAALIDRVIAPACAWLQEYEMQLTMVKRLER